MSDAVYIEKNPIIGERLLDEVLRSKAELDRRQKDCDEKAHTGALAMEYGAERDGAKKGFDQALSAYIDKRVDEKLAGMSGKMFAIKEPVTDTRILMAGLALAGELASQDETREWTKPYHPNLVRRCVALADLTIAELEKEKP